MDTYPAIISTKHVTVIVEWPFLNGKPVRFEIDESDRVIITFEDDSKKELPIGIATLDQIKKYDKALAICGIDEEGPRSVFLLDRN